MTPQQSVNRDPLGATLSSWTQALETLLGSEREQLLSQLIGKEITNPVDSSDVILVLEAIRAGIQARPGNFLERAIMRIQSKQDDELLKELKAE